MLSIRMARRRAKKFYTYLSVLSLICFAVWVWGLFGFAAAMPMQQSNRTADATAIVVLTGGSGRLEQGLELLSQDTSSVLFISGVYQGLDVRQLLQKFRDNPDHLVNRVEIGNATSTYENALETAAWVKREGYDHILLITAAYHMQRSMLEFMSQIPNTKITPYAVFPEHVKSPWWRWPGTAVLVIKEYSKYQLAWLRIQVTSWFNMIVFGALGPNNG